MYVIYKNFEKIDDARSLQEAAEKLGAFRQAIGRNKVIEGFYKWKGYFIFNPQNPMARARYNFVRLQWFINNPATAYVASLEINKAVDNIKSRILE